jgi:hypothetical protein
MPVSSDHSELLRSPERILEAEKQLKANIVTLVAGDKRGEGEELSPDDLQTVQDTFEGVTGLDRWVRAALLLIRDANIIVTGTKAEIETLKARKQRYENRIERLRGFIEQAMAIAEFPKLELDIATVSAGKEAPRVIVLEEHLIPSQFFKRAEPVLDKAGLNRVVLERHKALTAALALNDESERKARLEYIDREMPEIKGVTVETGGVKLNIRTK